MVRELEMGSNDLPCWACPLCQMEHRRFQGFKTLHKHLYEMHPERLVHLTSIAYLAAFWSGSIVSHMCLRMMDRLELHLEPNQSLNEFKSLAPPRPTWWPANDPEYFNEELTLDPWVSIAVKSIPVDMERAESEPVSAIHESLGELPEAGMARSCSDEALTRGRLSRQSIDNSHPAIGLLAVIKHPHAPALGISSECCSICQLKQLQVLMRPCIARHACQVLSRCQPVSSQHSSTFLCFWWLPGYCFVISRRQVHP